MPLEPPSNGDDFQPSPFLRAVEPSQPDRYDYFAYERKDQLASLNEQITEREKRLFELEIAALSLDGNIDDPSALSHEDFAAAIANARKQAETKGETFVQNQPCPCNACSLDRVKLAMQSLRYSLGRMRALAGTLTTGAKS